MDKPVVPVDQILASLSTCHGLSNPNKSQVTGRKDDPVNVLERKMEGLKLDYKFSTKTIKHVPFIFQKYFTKKRGDLKRIELDFDNQHCKMKFKGLEVVLEKKENDWMICYNPGGGPFKSKDPEASIAYHLWFVLKNPRLKVSLLRIDTSKSQRNCRSDELNVEKLSSLLLSMLDSFKHKFEVRKFDFTGLNEDTFLSMLQHIKPPKLEVIFFNLSWKEEGNYQIMDEIVKARQWKTPAVISSIGVTPLKIEDLMHVDHFCLALDEITLEDVLRISEHVFKRAGGLFAALACFNGTLDFDAILDALRSQNDDAEFTEISAETEPIPYLETFRYNIVKSGKRVQLFGREKFIWFRII